MKVRIRIFLVTVVCSLFFASCSGDREASSRDDVVEYENKQVREDVTIPIGNIISEAPNTRSLWSFNSDNLSITRQYEQGDILYIFNPYLTDLYFQYNASYHDNELTYRPATNNFKGSAIWNKSWSPPNTWGPKMTDADSLMLLIIDKNCSSWKFSSARDTSMTLDLTRQLGTQKDCFSRQLVYLCLPRSLYSGTHLWTNMIIAYYWLEFKFPDKDVASIDTIRVHADEPMPSNVAWKWRGYLSKNYTEYKGPYAIGTNSFSSTGADAFIAFYTGNGTTTFNNFGFDISYTLTNGTKRKGSSNVRPQVKTAAAGNLYKNAFMISGAKGVQNMYVDEIVEVDKWTNVYNGTVIAPKSGVEHNQADTTTAE